MNNPSGNIRQKRIEQISGMFMQLMWLTHRRYWRLLQPFGITFPQFMALAMLYLHRDRCTMTDLSHVSPHQDPAAMTGVVDRLVKQGWVERHRSETDRRVVMVNITADGRALVDAVGRKFAPENATLHADITDEDLDFACNMLRRYLHKEIEHYDWIHQDAVDKELRIVEKFMNDPVAFAREEVARE